MIADSLTREVRYALRSLRSSPLFASSVAGTIGLGLGILCSAFTILNGYLLKPIDLPRAKELYALSWDTEAVARHGFRRADFEVFRDTSGGQIFRTPSRRLPARAGCAGPFWRRSSAVRSERGDLPDLILTDIVLTGMSGPELASQLRLLHSSMRILFMSGYVDLAALRKGRPIGAADIIQKAFTADALSRKVREALDASPS